MDDAMDRKRIILTIREYENSVGMPEEERVTYLDPRNAVHLKDGDASAAEHAAYAEKCAEYLRFGREVNAVVEGTYGRYEYLKICETPQIFLEAGFEQKPMLYTQKHLHRALQSKDADNPHRHGLTLEQIKRLPALLESPVIFADNPSREDAMLVVLCAVDSDKLPIITSVKPDGHGHYEMSDIETNIVLTVFGKKNFDRYFQSALTPDMLLYLSKGKGQELERLAERQLLGNYSSLDLDTIIRRPQCIVNMETAGQSACGLASEAKDARAASTELGRDGTGGRV